VTRIPQNNRRAIRAAALVLVLGVLGGCSDSSNRSKRSSADGVDGVDGSDVDNSSNSTSTIQIVLGAAPTVDVAFDAPGELPRPIHETDLVLEKPSNKLSMNISAITYRGVVCGFSFKGTRPVSPVTIQMKGTKSNDEMFDSGPINVEWEPNAVVANAGTGANNGWSFSANAAPNRSGPGWVISLGGVTPEAENAVPTSVGCELATGGAFDPANGPIGHWAGFATK
jgi:hypothetical protein